MGRWTIPISQSVKRADHLRPFGHLFPILISAEMASAEKLVLRGISIAADSYGHPRFLLTSDSKYDNSWAVLIKNVPARNGYHMPYTLKDKPDADGVRGEFAVSFPTRRSKYDLIDRKAHFLKILEPLRGKEVEVTVQAKRFTFAPAGSAEKITGYTLVLCDVRDPSA